MFTKKDILNILNDQTPSKSRASLTRGDVAAMKAICALFRRQTADEQAARTTRHDNNVGFSQAHARLGTELAEWMSGGRGDGVLRRPVGGAIPQWTKIGVKPNGKPRWKKNQSVFVGRDRIAVCREIATVYARQLADEANRNR